MPRTNTLEGIQWYHREEGLRVLTIIQLETKCHHQPKTKIPNLIHPKEDELQIEVNLLNGIKGSKVPMEDGEEGIERNAMMGLKLRDAI